MSERPDLEYISVSANDLATLIAERTSATRKAREAQERFEELQQKHGTLRLSLIVRLGFTCPVSDSELIEAAERAWRVAQGIAEGSLVDESAKEVDAAMAEQLREDAEGDAYEAEQDIECVSCGHSFAWHPEPRECGMDGCDCRDFVHPNDVSPGMLRVVEALRARSTDG